MATNTWNPPDTSTDMNKAANWSLGAISSTDDLVFDATKANNATATTGLAVASITIASTYAGVFGLAAFTHTLTGYFTDNRTGTGAWSASTSTILNVGGNFTKLGNGSGSIITINLTGNPTVTSSANGTHFTRANFVCSNNVVFAGGSTSINRLKCAANKSITFLAGATYTMVNYTANDWSGAAGNLVTWLSSTPNTVYNIILLVVATASYISITDCNAVSSTSLLTVSDGTSVRGTQNSGLILWDAAQMSFYCDPAAVGTEIGLSWTNAWTSINSYLTVYRCYGDNCYARGLQNIASAGPIPTLVIDGSAVYGGFSIIGCAANGVARTGQFTIQGKGGDLPVDLLNMAAMDRWTFENITFDAATTQLIHFAGTSVDINFIKCRFINSSGIGVVGVATAGGYVNYILCDFQNNTGKAVSPAVTSLFIGCEFISNTGGGIFDGLNTNENIIAIFCIFHANGDDDISIGYTSANVILCSNFNGNLGGSCIKMVDAEVGMRMFFNKFTSANQYGIEVVTASDTANKEDYNYFYNNLQDARLNCATGLNSVAATIDGNIATSLDDFRTSFISQLRRISLNMDWHLATNLQKNIIYPTAGLPPSDRIAKNNKKG